MGENIKVIIEREHNNFNKIYLYLNSELGQCYAYEFSAYLLARLFPMLEFKEIRDEGCSRTVSACVPLQFVVNQFSDSNVTVGDEFIRVIIDDLKLCSQWKADFNEMRRLEVSGR